MELEQLEILDEIAQSIYGVPVDELTPKQYDTCKKEAHLYTIEKQAEIQYSRL